MPPIVVLLATAPHAVSAPAALLFAVASVTDFLDGYLARVAQSSSRFGRIADPLADRLLIDSALVLLVYHDRLPWWLAVPMLLRDVLLMGIFRVRHTVTEVHVNFIGKCATAALMIALFLLMLVDHQWPLAIYAVGMGLAGSAAALYFREPREGGLESRPS